LGAASSAEEEQYAEKMRYSAPSHEPNLRGQRWARQIT
jgi:hypothetical protein